MKNVEVSTRDPSKNASNSFAILLSAGTFVVLAWKVNDRDKSNEVESSPNDTVTTGQSSSKPESTDRPASTIDPSIVDYVGSTACRDCHHEIWEKYQSHPMANSFAPVSTASPIEDDTKATEFTPPGNRRYRVEQIAETIRHHEIMVDRDGEVIYDQSVPVNYTIGSGKRGRAYVIDREGLLFKSSISLYSEQREWGLSPDYLPEQQKRFERRVAGGCLTCHAGLPNFVRAEADRFGSPPLLEAAIGCERCHGPGRNHVAFWGSVTTVGATIVNPGKLDFDRREAVCAQCHLHGESRILRSGRTPHDFRPGERLDENWVIFVKSHGTGLTRSERGHSR